ncbi:MAG: phosphate transporter permease subunit PstC [Methanoregulaceae archaeon PtaU1.Bin222]|nr:MAG: phosphate transporter permease subunit PstC [Methanoregulaceae archaeon PtaU1.Bin222]
MKFRNGFESLVFLVITLISALSVLFIIGFIFWTAAPVLEKEGIGFLTGSVWNYEEHTYGAFNFILGTLIMTVVTMLIAVPLGLLTAIYLAEWAPGPVEKIIRPAIELLVGIPSVVYGIFGFFVLEKFFRNTVDPTIDGMLGWIPVFHDPDPGSGTGILLASTILAIMVLPTIVALSQEALRSVPSEYWEASLAMGATRWETMKKVTVPAAFVGIVTSVILAMMRAMGETMAVVMVIGNSAKVPTSILDNGYAMTSKILNDIGYYIAEPEPKSALFALAAVLFCIEIVFVFAARLVSHHINVRR